MMTTHTQQLNGDFMWMRSIGAVVLTILGSVDGVVIAAQLIQNNVLLAIIDMSIFAVTILFAILLYRMARSYPRTQIALILIPLFLFLVLIFLIIKMPDITINPIQVAIVDPVNGDSIEREHVVQGTVSDPGAKVFVVVHPLAANQMWVQNLPLVSVDGTWQTTVFFGTDTVGDDEQFEIMLLQRAKTGS